MCDVIFKMVGGVAIFVLHKTRVSLGRWNIREIGKKGKSASFEINKLLEFMDLWKYGFIGLIYG